MRISRADLAYRRRKFPFPTSPAVIGNRSARTGAGVEGEGREERGRGRARAREDSSSNHGDTLASNTILFFRPRLRAAAPSRIFRRLVRGTLHDNEITRFCHHLRRRSGDDTDRYVRGILTLLSIPRLSMFHVLY